MIFATLLLICSVPQLDDTTKVVNASPAVVSASATKESTLVASLPSAPAPKVKTDFEPIAPNPAARPFQPLKPVFTRPRETARQRKIWYGLALAGHSGNPYQIFLCPAVSRGPGNTGFRDWKSTRLNSNHPIIS